MCLLYNGWTLNSEKKNNNKIKYSHWQNWLVCCFGNSPRRWCKLWNPSIDISTYLTVSWCRLWCGSQSAHWNFTSVMIRFDLIDESSFGDCVAHISTPLCASSPARGSFGIRAHFLAPWPLPFVPSPAPYIHCVTSAANYSLAQLPSTLP